MGINGINCQPQLVIFGFLNHRSDRIAVQVPILTAALGWYYPFLGSVVLLVKEELTVFRFLISTRLPKYKVLFLRHVSSGWFWVTFI